MPNRLDDFVCGYCIEEFYPQWMREQEEYEKERLEYYKDT